MQNAEFNIPFNSFYAIPSGAKQIGIPLSPHGTYANKNH